MADSTLSLDIGVTEDGVIIEDPKSFEVRMRARYLRVQLLRDLKRERESREVLATMPDDWRTFLEWEEDALAEAQAKRNRRPIWMFFAGLAVGLLVGAVAIFGVHGQRESVAARIQSCETITGEPAMCLTETGGENPW